MQAHRQCRSQSRAEEERGGEHAAHRARAHGGDRFDEFRQQQADEEFPREVAVQDLVRRALAIAPDLRIAGGNRADDRPAQREPQIQRWVQPSEHPRAGRKHPEEARAERAAQHAEQEKQPSCSSDVNSNAGTEYHGAMPKNVRLTSVATTDAPTSGAKQVMEKLPSTICAAKTAPASGAL